jgi:hypothetical protein
MIQRHSDRRQTVRTHILAGGLLAFNGRRGVRGFRAIDVSDRGLKLRTHRHAILSIAFDLSSTISQRFSGAAWSGGTAI